MGRGSRRLGSADRTRMGRADAEICPLVHGGRQGGTMPQSAQSWAHERSRMYSQEVVQGLQGQRRQERNPTPAVEDIGNALLCYKHLYLWVSVSSRKILIFLSLLLTFLRVCGMILGIKHRASALSYMPNSF